MKVKFKKTLFLFYPIQLGENGTDIPKNLTRSQPVRFYHLFDPAKVGLLLAGEKGKSMKKSTA